MRARQPHTFLSPTPMCFAWIDGLPPFLRLLQTHSPVATWPLVSAPTESGSSSKLMSLLQNWFSAYSNQFYPHQISGALGSIFVFLFLRMYFLIGVVCTWATLSTQSPSFCRTSPQSSPTSQCEPPHRIHYIFPLALVALLSGDSWLLCFPDPFSRAYRLWLWQPHIRASLLSPMQTEGWGWSSLKSPLRTRHRSVKLYSKCSPLVSHVHGTMPDSGKIMEWVSIKCLLTEYLFFLMGSLCLAPSSFPVFPVLLKPTSLKWPDPSLGMLCFPPSLMGAKVSQPFLLCEASGILKTRAMTNPLETPWYNAVWHSAMC